ncbi:hypothetical protein [Roseibium alexandrii]|uniref:hypothetical protein n=1 Tax=Roseibium alexandrii TaxID=388408 RepID=UPI0037507D22
MILGLISLATAFYWFWSAIWLLRKGRHPSPFVLGLHCLFIAILFVLLAGVDFWGQLP